MVSFVGGKCVNGDSGRTHIESIFIRNAKSDDWSGNSSANREKYPSRKINLCIT